MSQDVLHDFAKLKAGSTPAPKIGIGHNRPPGGVPKAVLATFAASFGVLLVALAAPAFGAPAFGLLFVIFAICLFAYFGGAFRTPIVRESDGRGRHDMVATGSGNLTPREAAWQILPLPILLAGFGIFAAAAKAAIFA